MSLSAMSIHLLNTSRDGDSTTSLGSLFQCFISLSVMKFFRISNLNLPWCNLRLLPLVLLLVTWENRPTATLLTASFQVLVEWWDLPTASSSPDWTTLVGLHRTCSPEPSLSSLQFFGHATAPEYLSCSDGPKTEHSIQHVVSPV